MAIPSLLRATALRTLYRVLRPQVGRVSVDGRDVWTLPAKEAARATAAVVQDGPAELDLTVSEYVATGRVPRWTTSSPPS